ncbi:1060_t:CDS:2 [Entrophospora sp. SA101]|nr:1060_t:CDS:2 [Entrophospora sp. SA101]
MSRKEIRLEFLRRDLQKKEAERAKLDKECGKIRDEVRELQNELLEEKITKTLYLSRMTKTKKIILLGYQGVEKTTFYQKLVKNYASKQVPAAKISSGVNYTEYLIQFKSNYYFLIDVPTFIPRPQTEIEKAIQKHIEELLKETEQKEYQISLFQRLGQNYLYPFSAPNIANLEKVMEKIISFVPSPELPHAEKDNKIKLTIFGPPNSGKSTLLNYLLKKNRSLVSPVAGTTQEPVKDY